MDVKPSAGWTVLIYTSASRDLEEAVGQSLQEICDGFGPPDQVQVAAQLGWRGQAQRFQLHHQAHPKPLAPPEALDMTEPAQLTRFLQWGMRAYPAQHYAVVLGGHGAGFGGAVTDTDRRRMLPLPQLEAALGELPRAPDLVVFNTCLMAQAEVAAQLAPVTPHLVASQTELKGLGLPLAGWIQHLPACPEGGTAAQALVAESSHFAERSPLVSALDLEKWPLLSDQLNGLAQQILQHPQSRDALLGHIATQKHLWPRDQDRPLVDQLDLVSLCNSWQQDKTLPRSLRRQAGKVSELVGQLCGRSAEGGSGISIYAPDRPFEQLGTPQGPLGELYGRLRMARNTLWDEAIAQLVSE